VFYHQRIIWHSRNLDRLPVALHTPPANCNARLFYLLKTDSAAFYTGTSTNHRNRLVMQYCLTPICYAKFCAFFLVSRQILSMKRYFTFTSLHTFMTHTSCVIRLLHIPIDSVSCNANRKLSTASSLHSSTRLNVLLTNTFRTIVYDIWLFSLAMTAAINKFPNCVKRCMKIS
jgi:hypothetical protein